MKDHFYLILVLACLCFVCTGSAQNIVITGSQVPVTESDNRPVRRCIYNDIHAYKGIPYAQEKHFEAAKKPTK